MNSKKTTILSVFLFVLAPAIYAYDCNNGLATVQSVFTANGVSSPDYAAAEQFIEDSGCVVSLDNTMSMTQLSDACDISVSEAHRLMSDASEGQGGNGAGHGCG